jgi:hypothetical protein
MFKQNMLHVIDTKQFGSPTTRFIDAFNCVFFKLKMVCVFFFLQKLLPPPRTPSWSATPRATRQLAFGTTRRHVQREQGEKHYTRTSRPSRIVAPIGHHRDRLTQTLTLVLLDDREDKQQDDGGGDDDDGANVPRVS